MKYLGIDYGRRKIGLAMSDGRLAEPLKVIRYRDIELLVKQIKEVIAKQKTEKIVIGLSENEMGEEIKRFYSNISSILGTISCELFDETLTTRDAQELSKQAGMSRKKRRELEDAFAASIMLQNYLDSKSVLL